MGIIRQTIFRIAAFLGFLPKPVSSGVQFQQMLHTQVRGLRQASWICIVGVICYTISSFLVEPRRLDQSIAIFFGVLVIIMIDIAHMQINHLLVWVTQTFECLKALEAQHREIQVLHEIQGMINSLYEIKEEGWLFSLGVMNTHDRTGPTAFVWRPDVVISEGKVESRAYVGKGDTIEQAVHNAIVAMRAANPVTVTEA